MNTLDPITAGAAAPPPANRESLRVLIVDDNETDRLLTIRHIEKAWPFQSELAVDYAADGWEALLKIGTGRFKLIVLDWTMPVLGGRDLLLLLRKHGVRIPVVVLTGLTRDQITDDLQSLGAAFLNKDGIEPSRLHDAIAESLQLLGHLPVTLPRSTPAA